MEIFDSIFCLLSQRLLKYCAGIDNLDLRFLFLTLKLSLKFIYCLEGTSKTLLEPTNTTIIQNTGGADMDTFGTYYVSLTTKIAHNNIAISLGI